MKLLQIFTASAWGRVFHFYICRKFAGMSYNYNGTLIGSEKIELPVSNRAMNYGDGVFETMKYSNKRINFWEDHYFRLMASMRILRMEIPMSFSPDYLEEQLRKTLEENDLSEKPARLKLLVFRKEGGFYTPKSNEVDFVITVSELPSSTYDLNSEGLEVDLFKDFYKQKSLLSTLKTSSSTLYTVASIFREENQLDECILLNDNKMVLEAISANLFMVKGKTVFTPPVSEGCLKGVMRKNIIQLLPKTDYEIKEETFSPFELQKADELFLTNAVKGIQWVGKYRKKEFGNTCSTALAKKLNIMAAIG